MDKYDVIVVGAGTAGAIAALAAARRQTKVMVLEATSYPGGLQTGGFIDTYCNQPPTGIALELEKRAQALWRESSDYATVTEVKKMVMEDALIKSGCELHYEVAVVGVIKDNDHVRGVSWSENGKIFSATANTVIDASAEAVVARLAGCELRCGRESDGRIQHTGILFFRLIYDNGKRHYCYRNMSIRVNPEDIESFSLAFLQGSAWMINENHGRERIAAVSEHGGMREGPHIVSLHKFEVNDFLLDKYECREPIAYAYAPFDSCVSDTALESEAINDYLLFREKPNAESILFILPREMLFPHDVRGLMVAGRHIATDYDLGKAVRMNAAMSLTGEAAGIIAAIATHHGIAPDQVPYEKIRPQLNLDYPEAWKNEHRWGLSEADIVSGLESDFPRQAVWSAYRQRKRQLLENVFSRYEFGDSAKFHAGAALALLGERSMIPFLRATVIDGIAGVDLAARRGWQALYLLGRFRDPNQIDLIAQALAEAAPMPSFEYLYIDSLDEMKYQYHSYALTALWKIGESYPAEREKIAAIIRRYCEDPQWQLKTRFINWNPECLMRADVPLRIMSARHLNAWGIAHAIDVTLRQIPLQPWEQNALAQLRSPEG